MTIPFHKYHGTGNDFILIDQRETHYLQRDNQVAIEFLCHRHFGIGADGLMLLQQHETLDFEMIYFNADGRASSMCGNGGRCIVAFAHQLGMFEERCTFQAIDGEHEAIVKEDWVELKMSDVTKIETRNDEWFLQTGSPHVVRFVEQMEAINIVAAGSEVRYSDDFSPEGTNVNFVQIYPDFLEVATYERGVENETLSCGTGVTAAALAYAHQYEHKEEVAIHTKGGNLKVKFKQQNDGFTNIWLCGSAKLVFEGRILLSQTPYKA